MYSHCKLVTCCPYESVRMTLDNKYLHSNSSLCLPLSNMFAQFDIWVSYCFIKGISLKLLNTIIRFLRGKMYLNCFYSIHAKMTLRHSSCTLRYFLIWLWLWLFRTYRSYEWVMKVDRHISKLNYYIDLSFNHSPLIISYQNYFLLWCGLFCQEQIQWCQRKPWLHFNDRIQKGMW